VRHARRIAAAGAVLAALGLPALAVGQNATPTITESPSAGFPDRTYLLGLPETQALTADKVEVTENGNPVAALAVTPPGGSNSGAVLLIDASNSMKGEPIEGATVAARAFLDERKEDLPVGIITFNPNITVLSDFTTESDELKEAVAQTPTTAEGTHIYDAIIEASKMAQDAGQERTTFVLLSDGANYDTSNSSLAEALAAATEANVRIISIGLKSDQYTPETLQTLARRTGGRYIEADNPAALEAIYTEIGQRLSNEYEVTYRSLLPPEREAVVVMEVKGYVPATATYTTPALDLQPRGTFERSWVDTVITSPWLMLFVAVAVLALLAFAVLTVIDIRKRSLKRRMAQYVTVPTEEESRLRRAEVAQILAERAQKTVGGQRWWQRFESDVELSGIEISPLALSAWTLFGGILISIGSAIALQSLWGLLIGLVTPLFTHLLIKMRVKRKRKAFAEQLPDNLDVLAGALRAGHSFTGAMSQMMDGAAEPSKTEFRRALQDEQLGVPMDQAMMVMRHRMDNLEVEQLAIVTRLQADAGGNTAEVLDQVAENIRSKMELRRLVRVLTAQGRLAMWVLIGMPIALLGFISFINPRHLEPMFGTLIGNVSMGAWVVMMILGWWLIRKIVDIDI
jgi:tight adherence protein B